MLIGGIKLNPIAICSAVLTEYLSNACLCHKNLFLFFDSVASTVMI